MYANVVTTIQSPTDALSKLAAESKSRGELLFVVGDQKSPLDFFLDDAKYISVNEQINLDFQVLQTLPWNSYTRKMLGYLEAAKSGCAFIRETDDDNFPLDGYFLDFPKVLQVRRPQIHDGWINPYIYFSDDFIWPRGFPLNLLEVNRGSHHKIAQEISVATVLRTGVIQGLADGAPDVDAVFRLVFGNADDFRFKDSMPLLIPRGCFAPFNSQVTTWTIDLLPLMYLPQTCTFRMTDIWRSFIATHLMHLNEYDLVFTGASAYQDRNAHNLLRDFSDEVPGYVGNDLLVNQIKAVVLRGGMENLGLDLIDIYEHLTVNGFFQAQELVSLKAWLEDCDSL